MKDRIDGAVTNDALGPAAQIPAVVAWMALTLVWTNPTEPPVRE